MAQMRGDGKADRQRRELVVGDGAEGESGPGVAEEEGERRDHGRGDSRRDQVELADEHAGDVDRRVVDAEVETVDLRAPDAAAPRPR